MEAQQLRDRRRRRQALLGGIILALIAAVATYVVLTRDDPGTATPTPPPRTIVVAAVDIPARTQITEEMLTTIQVADSPALATVISDPELAIDQFAAVDIGQDQPLLSNFLRTGTAAGVAVIPPGETLAPDSPTWRAVSIEAPVASAVGGMLEAGDHIDLYVTLSPKIYDVASLPGFYDPGGEASTAGFYAAETTRLVWTNLELLEVDVERNLYILRVDDRQAEEIAHVQSVGAQFTIGLRAANDDRVTTDEQRGQTTNQLMELYGFPIPVVIYVPTGPAPPPAPTPEPEETPAPEEP